uniref:Uncharacterized protein n=1 Tax=Loa loa TaxID=7209 RepID=A0A1I7VEP7_LOALO
MYLTPLDQKSTIEVLCQQYETRASIIKEKLMRLERYVGTLEKINDKWLEHIQQRRRRRKKRIKVIPIVNLPQLLPTFSGDPKTCGEFRSSFEASVHSQNIPDIQKLNYLISCLKGSALQLVKGYDRAPENYKIIRELLEEKFDRVSTIRNLLYKELVSTKRNDRNWKTTVEEMERVLRQLEAIGEKRTATYH